jgi:site-specific DNA-methyltransferase (adenine-specific)
MALSIVENIDCMVRMREAPDKFWDLAIVDPQFGIGNFVQQTGNVRGERVEWNDAPPSSEYFEELRRVTKHRIIFGANYFNCFDGKKGALIWVKNQPMPDFSKAVIASCSFHAKVEIYEQTWTNFVAKDRQGIHPCEMPIDIFKWCLSKYGKENDKILDTHLGSGSSRIAANDMGFDFTGFELDTDYFLAQEKRFKQHISQLKIFQP